MELSSRNNKFFCLSRSELLQTFKPAFETMQERLSNADLKEVLSIES